MAPPVIVVSNLRDHEIVPHALVVFDGYVADFPSLALAPPEWFLDARLDAARGAFWPINGSGRFKALVLLPAPGRYNITLRLGAHTTRVFPIEYQPPVARHVVRFYYQKCHDAAPYEGFDAPPGVDNSDEAAIQRIRFNALLLQAATAEMFVHAGLPRRTFAVEFAPDGLPHVRLLRSSFTNATARSIHDQKLIQLVENDLVACGFDEHAELEFKHAVILGCSKYNPATQKSDGHTALGGGKVGIFGSSGLHTWPRHLGEVAACCLNNARIDTRVLMDDSGYRGTFWGNFSTGIGAFIHELGHTFGLGHATSGIMARGFDDMTRLFCAYEPDHKRNEPGFFQDFLDGRLALNHQVLREVSHPQGAHWNVGSALQLVHCPWISARPKASTCGPSVCWNNKVRGPVGQNNTRGTKRSFGTEPLAGPLGAVLISAHQYLEDLKTYTRAEYAQLSDHVKRQHTHKLVLGPSEYVTSVEVRAMAWIDGLRIHTNVRSTPWIGGHGGELHVLRPDESSKINGFFGARGDDFVGSLGVHCGPIAELAAPVASPERFIPSTAVKTDTIGLAEQDGAQTAFDQQLDDELAAIAVRSGDYVESVQTCTRRDWVAMGEPAASLNGLHWFVLQPGEFITHADVRAMCWVDAVRFHTNLRASPWFGGSGGELMCLQPPPGFQINSFYGSIGQSYVGRIGAVCVPMAASTARVPDASQEPVAVTSVAPFALRAAAPPADFSSPHVGVARGVLVAVQDGVVMFVSSFDSSESKASLIEELGAFVAVGAQLHSFSLHQGELLVQIDVSLDAQRGTVEGLCVHTTSRCSSWFGAYTDSQLWFMVAPAGSVVKSVRGVAGATQLQDIVGEFCPRGAAMQGPSELVYGGSRDGSSVQEDAGEYDIRVEDQSSYGLDSVYLLKKLPHEELEQHAWAWKTRPGAPAPHLWCLPQRMLEHHLVAEAGTTPTQLLFSGYAIGAMDTGGGYSMAASPPPRV